ncbi:hypothetical protein E6C27_scaffold382G00260 [Cucumis melo var. makuwa]|uniref:Uncharacterized protein n=1 Tax=Cucumis melo var. makuwa TaxID=1194695 RepID=A0A5A7V8D6_CUCMM|nr:hypothetical protein E6C27_scaffold382G00260 [Cucumis melo var. makuwa]
MNRGNTAVSDPTSIGGRSGFCRQINCPGRSDRAPSSFGEVILPSAIHLLSTDDQAFAVRSTALVRAIRHFVFWRGDTAVSDPTSIKRRSGFYRQIHHPGRNDRAPSSFGEVILLSAIQLLSRGDRAFPIRSTVLVKAIGHLHPPLGSERSDTFVVWRHDTAVSDPTSIEGRSGFCRQIHRSGRSDQAPSSFREVILPSVIQLLSGDDRAFAIRSTALERSGTIVVWRGDTAVSDITSIRGLSGFYRQIHHPSRNDRAPSSFREGDDRAFVIRSTALVGAIRHLVLWRGDTAINDPTSIGGRSSFCRQIHRLDRSDRVLSSFGEERSGTIVVWRGDTAVSDITSIRGLSGFYRQIHHPSRNDRAPSSFREGDDRAFVIRSTALVGAIRHLVLWRGDTAINDPTSIGGRSSFCRQIHRLDRSDRVLSSFGEVILPSAIQLLSGDDRTLTIRSIALIHRPGRSDWAPSSFREVILPSAIQLLSGDDRAFVVRSTALVGAIGHLCHLERRYCCQRSNLYKGTIGLLPSDPPLW